MNRTEQYFNLVTNYRTELRQIWDEYENEARRIERYRGSVGFDDESRKAQQKRDKAISDLQGDYRTRFASVVRGMRESAQNAQMIAPTQEQLSILTALKMRKRLDRDEIEQAGRSLQGCPVALSVLEEMAAKNSFPGVSFGGMSSKAIHASIEALAHSFDRLCKLDRCDSRAEMVQRASVHSPEWSSTALFSFRVDTDPETERKCMTVFGDVPGDYLEDFQSAVNN